MALVELKNLKKTYSINDQHPEVKALRGINLDIEKGEYVAIMGPSGSGKTTMLNLLGCLDRATKGEYRLNNHDLKDMDDHTLADIRCRFIGFIFQSYHLIPQLSVIENIEVPLFYNGISEKEGRKKAIDLAHAVDLGSRLNHKPFQLSGGQQQRVAIARALANDPLMILADEPTGNLDSESGEKILQLLERQNNMGITLLIVTHNREVAQRANRVILMRDGLIQEERVNQ